MSGRVVGTLEEKWTNKSGWWWWKALLSSSFPMAVLG